MTTVTSATDRYHHGDLPNALRRAAVEVIDERGLGAFSLREVARRAGVSHNAPAHHFGDMRGLLTSLAIQGFEVLHAATTAAAPIDDPVERLMAIGTAYLEVAKSHRAHCAVMFRIDLVDADDPALVAAGMRAYGVLEDAVRAVIDAEGLDVDVDDAVWLCWSAMQGLVELEPKIAALSARKGVGAVATSDLVHRFTALIVAGMRASHRLAAIRFEDVQQ
jgi:AcrR family transcriptional regulator